MYYKDILSIITKVLDDGEAGYLIGHIIFQIQQANRIFIAGAGRSGLVAKMFAMRLMHLEKKTVYVVGDVTTPGITTGDTLMIISGSGKTKTLIDYASVAQENGANIVVFTANMSSPLVAMSRAQGSGDVFFINTGVPSAVTPLGSLFELSTLILLEAVVARFMEICGITTYEMQRRHANLE